VEVLVSAIIASIVGAFSAFIFNIFHWQIVDKRNNLTSLGKLVDSTIQELEAKAVKYWVASEAIQLEDKKSLEIEIKSYCLLNNKLIIEFNAKISDKASISTMHSLNSFKDDIYDLVTGGEFESVSRVSEPRKAGKISKMCTKARSEVLKTIH
jgi:hypothetical protein